MARSREDLIALDRRHLWRPYTSSDDHAALDPIVVARAEGAWLEDADGRRFLDGNASWWCAALGHGHPRLRAALKRQADELLHVSFAGMTHAPAVELARELVEIAPPGLTRVFYSDNGSTAVEVALKIALHYWRQNGRPDRTRFLTLDGAYHGDTAGAMSIGGLDAFREPYRPLLHDALRAPPPDPDWEAPVDFIERTLRDRKDEIAAVVVEPLVQGAAGMRIYAAPFLTRIAEAARRADTFLIADEVFTGLGRTGRLWACDHAGVTPDILCTSKALTGGTLPFAATLTTERVHDGFRGGLDRALLHGHTFYGNPLGATVARELLAVYRDEDVVRGAWRKAPRLAEAFERLGRIEGVHRPRALGLVGAADLGSGGYHGRLGWDVHAAAHRRGAYLRPLGDTVYVCPPLTIPDDDLDRLLVILEASVREALDAPSR